MTPISSGEYRLSTEFKTALSCSRHEDASTPLHRHPTTGCRTFRKGRSRVSGDVEAHISNSRQAFFQAACARPPRRRRDTRGAERRTRQAGENFEIGTQALESDGGSEGGEDGWYSRPRCVGSPIARARGLVQLGSVHVLLSRSASSGTVRSDQDRPGARQLG